MYALRNGDAKKRRTSKKIYAVLRLGTAADAFGLFSRAEKASAATNKKASDAQVEETKKEGGKERDEDREGRAFKSPESGTLSTPPFVCFYTRARTTGQDELEAR